MYYAIVAVFGLVLGSFINVVIFRYDQWLSIMRTRSHCPHCQTTLGWFDLIPVLSYAYLGGKCRYCRKPISWQYPVVELAMAGLMTAGYYLIFQTYDLPTIWASVAFGFYILTVGGLLVVAVQDIRDMEISDSALNYLIVVSIGFILAQNRWLDGFYGALIGFVPIALLVYPSKGKWMGEGDVKLSTALGIMAGYPLSIVYLSMGFMTGGVFGILGLLTRRLNSKSAVPFGPFLIVGALIALFFGRQIVEWYMGGSGWYLGQ